MTISTLTLTAFLLARIAEDEEWGRLYGCVDAHEALDLNPRCQARVLAECAAKRRIVELHSAFECSNVRCKGGGLHCSTCEEGLAAGDSGNVHHPCPTIRALASVYADHPDYRQEWA